MVKVRPGLTSKLKKVVGDALRLVATHDERDYEIQYLRDDIAEGYYTLGEFQRIFEELVLEGIDQEYFEQLFHVGELDFGAWGFEDATILYFPGEDYTGLVVSADRDGPIDIDGLVETCRDAIVNEPDV